MSNKLQVGMAFGKWTLIRAIKSGGNGDVWEVKDASGNAGAIKFLQRRHLMNVRRYSRFKHEIEALAGCQDVPGVLPLRDRYLPEPGDNKLPWLVMSLAEPVEDALGPDPTLKQVVQACASFAETLAKLHRRGFSHRDIKPDNLFKCDSNWAVGDFGLVDFPDKTAVTQDGERVGPLHFMAQEMWTNADTADGAPADVYSLAKTLWVLATGQRLPLPGPHRADDEAYRVRSYKNEPNADKLDRLLAAATTIDPKVRITMAEFAAELRSWECPVVVGDLGGANLSHLKNLIMDLRLPAQRENARREQIKDECRFGRKRILERLKKIVTSVGEKLTTGGFPVGYQAPGRLTDNQNYFPDLNTLLNSNERGFEAFGAEAILENNGVRRILTAAAAVEHTWTENPRFAVHAAYRIDPSRKIVWKDSGSFLLGGMEEEIVISRVLAGLQEQLGNAVRIYLTDCIGIAVDTKP